jgi:hypothetical protein
LSVAFSAIAGLIILLVFLNVVTDSDPRSYARRDPRPVRILVALMAAASAGLTYMLG